ncbi:hypothetical protein TIFTF001_030076 [Ficus carica]|uniref:Uncharacterized protein n=1 Tax=Ficus carica TaxID=3494 RepID=A0AA88DSH2_FICCA|nr:hypothetical protein TIFTF001_030076 [Ficus carica]
MLGLSKCLLNLNLQESQKYVRVASAKKKMARQDAIGRIVSLEDAPWFVAYG